MLVLRFARAPFCSCVILFVRSCLGGPHKPTNPVLPVVSFSAVRAIFVGHFPRHTRKIDAPTRYPQRRQYCNTEVISPAPPPTNLFSTRKKHSPPRVRQNSLNNVLFPEVRSWPWATRPVARTVWNQINEEKDADVSSLYCYACNVSRLHRCMISPSCIS